MNRRSLLQVTGLAGAAALLAGCFGSNTHRWKQKLTVIVQAPSGERSGSAVTEVTASLGFNLNGGGNMAHLRLQGEATAVDLGNGKFLFALLSESSKFLTEFAFHRAKGEEPEAFWSRMEASTGTSAPVPGDHYPLLVTFDDLQDPKSVKQVKPSDFAAYFGPGYALKSVIIELTQEPVTEGIAGIGLPWLSQDNPIFIDWKQYPYDHPLRGLSKNSFIQGTTK